MKKPIVVAVSGGFDPVHIGHIELFREAKRLGNRMVIILNNDHWVRKKKGYVFMPERERAAVLKAVRYVDDVIITSHPENPEDMSVSAELEKLKPDIFANGGDRDEVDAADPQSPLYRDIKTCERLEIKIVFGLGKKMQSSTELIRKVRGQN